jgi:hypothetical protein
VKNRTAGGGYHSSFNKIVHQTAALSTADVFLLLQNALARLE